MNRTKAVKRWLLSLGGIIALVGVARIAIGGLGDPFAPLLIVGAVLVVLGLVWK